MSGKQATLGTQEPVISEDVLRQKLEQHGWSVSELADELNVSEKDIQRAFRAHGIKYNGKATGHATSGATKALWEMNPDDLGGESA